MIRLCLRAGRIKVLAVLAAVMTLIAFADWYVGNNFSLGVLYIVPMMLGAVVLRRFEILLLAIVCAFLKSMLEPRPAQVRR